MKKTIYILSAFFCSILYCTSQEPYHINYTSEDGLPSNEVYCVYQDTLGFMWFGTDNGVSRFDGYTFENFGPEHGLEKPEINLIIKDHQERVWYSSYSGKVYSFQNNTFIPYAWNHILDYYSVKSHLVNLKYIDNEGAFYFNIKYVGILIIHEDGCEELIAPDCVACELIVKTKSGFLLTESIHNRTHNDFKQLFNKVINQGQVFVHYIDLQNKDQKKIHLEHKFSTSSNHQIIQINDTVGLYNLRKQIYIIKNGELKPLFMAPTTTNIFHNKNDDLYIGYRLKEGMHVYRDWKAGQHISEPEKWLKNTEVSFMARDRNQGFWVTSINKGIFYYPNDRIKVFTSDLTDSDQKFAAIVPYQNQSLKAVNHTGGFIDIQQYRKVKELKLEDVNNAPDIALYNGKTFFRSNSIESDYKISRYKVYCPSRYERKVKTNDFFGSDRFYLYQYNPKSLNFDRLLDNSTNNVYIYDMMRDEKNVLWLATGTGLQQYVGGKLINAMPALLNIKTVSLDRLSTGEWAVATKGKGIYIINEKANKIINITTKNGLMTDIVDYLWVDDFDNIWAATIYGLHKIVIRSDNDILIKKYNRQSGLPSDEILMVRTQDSLVWVGTAHGVACFFDRNGASLSFKPEIIRMLVNEKAVSDLKNLSHTEDNIKIEIRNFDFNFGNKIKYRYRLKRDGGWTEQTNNVLHFIRLSPGKYNLEVQAQNKDNIWSASLIVPFTIHKPWWLTLPFLLFAGLVISGLAYTYYRSRINSLKTKQQLKTRMLGLEKQALLSQMNPHFIFNAFSAIQYYINTKATKKADDYLTDFSYLIRKILDNSNKKDILLSEEIKLIRLYTELEEKRFDQKFETVFVVDEEIDADATRLPCMLLQPLVENAINHGLMHLTERRGQLHIRFKDIQGALRIEVEDNGLGMEKTKDTSLHKMFDSYGLKLLNDRIVSYQNSGEYFITLSHEDLFDDGKPCGTRFILDIVKGRN